MPRATSPAASEHEVDILGDLFANDHSGAADGFDAGDILDGDDSEGDAAFIALKQSASFRKNANVKGKSVKKGGGFQSMGLSSNLLRAITRKGFQVPTPIQRKAIPLVLDRKDVVGMARTGSGKTAAFVIPMIERLRAHSATFGARALIMSPSRELAIQTLKVVKDFSRGTDLKCVLLVGGDSLEEQFGSMTANPDIIIATPGRFLHLKVEMSMNLSSIQYVVFDEADRLFEMGFAAQLTEILHALPMSRQTLLFSATLPASLVEFARAGLQEPSLVRLDAETKISPDLQSAFFSVKGAEKEGTLLHILHDVIKMPMGAPEGVQADGDGYSKKRKRGPADGPRLKEKPSEHSTIVFACTKHHVEYLAQLLVHAGFSVSYVYGSLDQTARKEQVDKFRKGQCNILVVTDVAARGIDIPILANVINYDFPPQPKVFVHRVGRTARAGQRGWSYSLVRDIDAPYLLDLQLFLGKKLVVGKAGSEGLNFTEDISVGAPQRTKVETNVEWLNRVMDESDDLNALKRVSEKAEKQYMRTRNSAAKQSATRARELVATREWTQLHPVFGDELGDAENARAEMMAKISGFKPKETIFEIGLTGKATKNEAAEIMKTVRQRFGPRRTAAPDVGVVDDSDEDEDEVMVEQTLDGTDDEDDDNGVAEDDDDDESVAAPDYSDDEMEITITNNDDGKSSKGKKKGPSTFKDDEFFMSYAPRTVNAAEERGYGVHSGADGNNFMAAARDVQMDLTNDEAAKSFGEPTRGGKLRWDKKNSKYVSSNNDEDGSKGTKPKMVRGESGVKIAASFQSGRFDRWKKAQRINKMPRVGETERSGPGGAGMLPTGARYKHKQERAPKEADKFRDDFHVRKKRVAEAKEKRIGKYSDGVGINRNELKGQEDMRKGRKIKEQKRLKNARPSKKQ
ncbi:P-loop containing nucleoside triphosphate hydrolase protein [Microdochium bolleyi]|uniref:RNA helicase n=1 Tax=Microdochium bolleyi TaxID=196109 RepID=A0A136J5D3_9PEZI|nr:P-loop containing nucleoside triphosphate hydrolase protein [Microdochium bolleyi]